jgi:hypothetical protein
MTHESLSTVADAVSIVTSLALLIEFAEQVAIQRSRSMIDRSQENWAFVEIQATQV